MRDEAEFQFRRPEMKLEVEVLSPEAKFDAALKIFGTRVGEVTQLWFAAATI